MSRSQNTGATPENSSFRNVIVASLVGTTIEWYDFLLYGSLAALVFNQIFFTGTDPLIGTLASLSTYAVGFFARPLGGILFGHFGDRLGRKKLLLFSLLLMGVGTIGVGLVPDYNTIGFWAPVLLVILRICQGVAVGGDWGGAVLLATEHAKPGKRGFAASWPQIGANVGNSLAVITILILSSTLSQEAFLSWGWRVPFIVATVIVLIGFWIRTAVAEPEVFLREKAAKDAAIASGAEQRKVPLGVVLRSHRRHLLIVIGAHIAPNILYYAVTTFSLVYLSNLGVNRNLSLSAVVIASLIGAVAIPFFGRWSDRVGRKTPYMIGAALMIVFAFAYFPILELKSFWPVTAILTAGLLIQGIMYGIQASYFAELFPTSVRYTGMSTGAQFATTISGGLTPIIATALLAAFHSWVPIAIYLAIAALITLIALAAAPETYKNDLAAGDASPVDRPRVDLAEVAPGT